MEGSPRGSLKGLLGPDACVYQRTGDRDGFSDESQGNMEKIGQIDSRSYDL